MIDLNQVTQDLAAKHGCEVLASELGVSAEEVQAWVEGLREPSASQLTRLLRFDPDPLQQIKPLYFEGLPEGQRLAICMNTNRAVDWRTTQSIVKLFDSTKMRLMIQPTNFLIRGRNQLAWSFLQTDCEWALWVDDDVVLPCGDAGWFQRAINAPQFPVAYAGLNTVYRLLAAGKTLVGGCYFARDMGGRAQFKEALVNAEVDRYIHTGPQASVIKTEWMAAGCMLVHRSVFTDIANQGHANRVSDAHEKHLRYRYGFFDPLEEGLGEDSSFCYRAKKAGHQSYIDLAVMPGHVGPYVFNYYNTR